jgi:exopolysaccharide biosynthesis polyprenyl glycosylphosphotransferase
MRNNASLVYGFFLVVGDFLALLAAFVAAYVLRVTYDPRPLIANIPFMTYLGIFLVLLPFWLIIFALIGLYNARAYENRFNEAGRLFIGCFIGILFLIGFDFVSPLEIFPARLVPVYAVIVSFLFLLLFRTIARGLRRMLFGYGIGINHVLIVGDTPITNELIRSLANLKVTGYKVVGVVTRHDGNVQGISPNRQFKTFESAIHDLRHEQVHSIIQTELYPRADQNDEILTFAQEHHIAYRFIPGNSELFVGKIDVDLFHSIPVIAVYQTALIGWGRIVKRIFDIFVGGLLFLICLPLMLLVAFVILVFDRGKVVFRQERLSRFDTVVRIYKFRTHRHRFHGMTPEEAFTAMGRPELIKRYRENGDQIDNDPRIGRLGRFLRRTKLDELPQLFNVVKGDISLVGPRALTPDELAHFPKKNLILAVKSGLTGLAQISGRHDMSFEERRKLDLYYVQNWSFWSDFVILLKTVAVVLFQRGTRS